MVVAQTRVRTLLAASPTGLAESSSLSLRTGIPPQVALHLSSRIRSYHCWMQGGNVTLEGTFTPLVKRLPRRTSSVCPRPNRATGLTRTALTLQTTRRPDRDVYDSDDPSFVAETGRVPLETRSHRPGTGRPTM